MRRSVVVVGLLALLSFGATLAQETPSVFCGDLSTADCSIRIASAQAMNTLESASFRFDLNVQSSNLPGMGFPFDLRLNGSGRYALDMAGLQALELAPELNELPGWVESALQAVQANATVVLHLPTALVDVHAATAAAFPSKVGFDLRLADGFAYLNLDKLAELDAGGGLPGGWMGIDLAGFYRRLLEQQLPFGAPGLGTGAASALADPALTAVFTQIERLADSSAGGQSQAVFRTTSDLSRLLADPNQREALRAALLASLERLALTVEDVDPLLEAYSGLLQGLVVETTEYIGLDDYYVHRLSLSLAWSPDLSALERLAGAAPVAASSVFSIRLNAQLSLDSFNTAAPEPAPEDVFIIPLNQFLPAPPSAGVRRLMSA